MGGREGETLELVFTFSGARGSAIGRALGWEGLKLRVVGVGHLLVYDCGRCVTDGF